MQCYRKNEYWSTCQLSCTPGVDPRDKIKEQTPWSCEKLGTRSAGTAIETTTSLVQAEVLPALPIDDDEQTGISRNEAQAIVLQADAYRQENLPTNAHPEAPPELATDGFAFKFSLDINIDTFDDETYMPIIETPAWIFRALGQGRNEKGTIEFWLHTVDDVGAHGRGGSHLYTKILSTGVWYTLTAEKSMDEFCVQLDSDAPTCRQTGPGDIQMKPVGKMDWGKSSHVRLRNFVQVAPIEENVVQELPTCAITRKEDCSKSRCCLDAGMQCFEKDEYWAACEVSCTPGIDPRDRSKRQTSWTCRRLGTRTPGEPVITTTPEFIIRDVESAEVMKAAKLPGGPIDFGGQRKPVLSLGLLASSCGLFSALLIMFLVQQRRRRSTYVRFSDVALEMRPEALIEVSDNANEIEKVREV